MALWRGAWSSVGRRRVCMHDRPWRVSVRLMSVWRVSARWIRPWASVHAVTPVSVMPWPNWIMRWTPSARMSSIPPAHPGFRSTNGGKEGRGVIGMRVLPDDRHRSSCTGHRHHPHRLRISPSLPNRLRRDSSQSISPTGSSISSWVFCIARSRNSMHPRWAVGFPGRRWSWGTCTERDRQHMLRGARFMSAPCTYWHAATVHPPTGCASA